MYDVIQSYTDSESLYQYQPLNTKITYVFKPTILQTNPHSHHHIQNTVRSYIETVFPHSIDLFLLFILQSIPTIIVFMLVPQSTLEYSLNRRYKVLLYVMQQ